MKLSKVRVREYKSIWDSNEFDIDRIACLVGKNEAGKTAIIEALYRLNPIVESDGNFDVTEDYPRSVVEDYRQDVSAKNRPEAIVVEATFDLEEKELTEIQKEYGKNALKHPYVKLSKGYAKNENGKCTLYVNLPLVETSIVKHLVMSYDLQEPQKSVAAKLGTLSELSAFLQEVKKEQQEKEAAAVSAANLIEDEGEKAAAIEKSKSFVESEQAKVLQSKVTELLKHKDLSLHIWSSIIKPHLPKFLYFNEYYQMRGHDNIPSLKKRKDENILEKSDYPLLGLINLARLDLDQILGATKTVELKSKLQGASNHLSDKVLKYWSQNKHLSMEFDVREGLSEDPEGMRSGKNIWGEVYDDRHKVSTGLATRSTGFVWFFSFLAWYSAEKSKNQPLILLLDEPGLSLHGKAQEDLLRYFDQEIFPNPKHQLIYTTHSPFMVDSLHFERVRIVQDKGIDAEETLPRNEDGTKVFTDVLEANADSLFPLQGALGYEIYQTLFIGPNSLIVEGVSDLLYIQTLSGILESKGKVGLDSRWTITPVGGSDKVPTFVALIGSQKNLNVATLIDLQKKDQQMIDNLYKKQLLKKSHVLTFVDFTGKSEADIEDMFDETLYLDLVNGEFSKSLTANIKSKDLTSKAPRMLVRLQDYFDKNPMKADAKFNHFRPARFLAEKISTINIPDATLERFEKAFAALNALLPK